MKKQTGAFNKIFKITLCVILAIYALSMILMLFWGLLTSLKSYADFGRNGNVLGFPDPKTSKDELFKLANYKLILDKFEFKKSVKYYSFSREITHSTNSDLWTMILNTLIYAGGKCIIMTIVPATVAYMCAKYRCKFSSFIYVAGLFVMATPVVGTQASVITFLRDFNLYDSFIGNFIQAFSFTGMYFFVFYAFFLGVSDSYAEAAEIDGASQFKVYSFIMLPLAIKIMMTVALINFVQLWNDYQTPLLYLPTHPTLSYGVYFMVFENTLRELSRVPIKIAACMLLAIPILIVFIFLKDKLMGNVSMGGVKE